MISDVFIKRPRLAIVISLVILIVGFVSLQIIPTAQYPEIQAPQIIVQTLYPGADATIVENMVAEVIETAINGVDGMDYMSSTSNDSGMYTLNIVFKHGTDNDINAVTVQNRIKSIEASLPTEVQRVGIGVYKESSNMVMLLSLYSPNGTYDDRYLTNYAALNIEDALVRVPGVANAMNFSEAFNSMRVWLDVDRMANLDITPTDVIFALSTQNIQLPVGSIGAQPMPDTQMFQFTVKASGRLSTPEEFANIVIRVNNDGSTLRLGDFSRVEVGQQDSSVSSTMNNRPVATMMITQVPSANGVQVAAGIRAEMERLSQFFPEDLAYAIPADMTTFVSYMVDDVYHTFFEAILLVVIVVFLFMGNWRATLIPIAAIPVSIIGTFAVLYITGSSANMITLLALVLAIGIVVDDAIVVVENVQRIMDENPKLTPKQATSMAMREITMPIIAITLVLLSVFVPMGFFPGMMGKLFSEFAIAVVSAVVLSAFNALTLSPALCGVLMRPTNHEKAKNPIIRAIEWPFDKFLSFIHVSTNIYAGIVGKIVKFSAVFVVLLVFVFVGIGGVFSKTPFSFLEVEDYGFIMGSIQLPDGASLNRTKFVSGEVTDIIRQVPGVKDVIVIRGYGGDGLMPNMAFMPITLTSYEERAGMADLTPAAIAYNINEKMRAYNKANVRANELSFSGETGALQLIIENTSGASPQEMWATANGFIVQANADERLANMNTTFSVNYPQLEVNVDREKALLMGVSLSDIYNTMQILLGGYHVNDYIDFGRTRQVNIQADARFRDTDSSITGLHVRNNKGELVSLSSFVTVKPSAGPTAITRYNNYRSVIVSGDPAPGFSTGQAIEAIESIGLPPGYTYEWTGSVIEQNRMGSSIGVILGLAFLFAFLFLVALYESWIIPVPVLLSTLVAILGGVLLINLRGQSIDLFVMLGIVVLIALSAKNAILMVEFSKESRENGHTIREAAIYGARTRFRPVIMTSIAFMGGVVPMFISTGASAMSQRSISTIIIGGMALSILIGIYFIPTLYTVFERIREFPTRKSGKDPLEEYAVASIELDVLDEMDAIRREEKHKRVEAYMKKRDAEYDKKNKS